MIRILPAGAQALCPAQVTAGARPALGQPRVGGGGGGGEARPPWAGAGAGSGVGLYKKIVYVEAVVHESTIHACPPPTCIVHWPPWCDTIARLLDSIRLPFRSPVCMLYTTQYW